MTFAWIPVEETPWTVSSISDENELEILTTTRVNRAVKNSLKRMVHCISSDSDDTEVCYGL